MAETLANDREANEQGGKPEGIAPLTPREIAIAQGEDPDAIQTAGDGGDGGDVGDAGKEDPKDGAGEGKPLGTEAHLEQDGGEGDEVGDGPTATDGGREAASEAAAWIDDDVKGLARSYGLTDDDLADFGDVEEFRRATRVIDRNLIAGFRAIQGASAAGQGGGQPAGGEAGQDAAAGGQPPQQGGAPAKKIGDQPADEDGLIDPQKYIDGGYDEETVRAMKALRAMQERHRQIEAEHQQLKQFVTGVQQAQQQSVQRSRLLAFHDAVDQLDGDRYGRSVNDDGKPIALGQKHDANRRKLHESANALVAGMILQARQAGREPEIPPLPVVLRRVEQLEFADEIRQAERRAYQEKVAAQSKRRRPSAGRGRPVAPQRRGAAEPEQPGDDISQIVNHPDLVKFWQQAQEENGAV